MLFLFYQRLLFLLYQNKVEPERERERERERDVIPFLPKVVIPALPK